MSRLQYSSYPGFGQVAYTNEHHSQVVRVENHLIMSGQVGLNPTTATSYPNISIPSDFPSEVRQAFSNVDKALKDAGGAGMSEVYKLVVYLAPWSDEHTAQAISALEEWFPQHKPALTGVGVEKLAFGARVEVDAYAHVSPEGK